MSRRTAALAASATALAAAFPATFAIAQEARTIQVATHYTEEQAAPLLACFDAYEAANPGVTVEHQVTAYGDFLQTILTSRVGGTAPDIYNVLLPWWVPQLASAGRWSRPPPTSSRFITPTPRPPPWAPPPRRTALGHPDRLSIYALV
jgi:multiple sugar transport system substrate-binding protein